MALLVTPHLFWPWLRKFQNQHFNRQKHLLENVSWCSNIYHLVLGHISKADFYHPSFGNTWDFWKNHNDLKFLHPGFNLGTCGYAHTESKSCRTKHKTLREIHWDSILLKTKVITAHLQKSLLLKRALELYGIFQTCRSNCQERTGPITNQWFPSS